MIYIYCCLKKNQNAVSWDIMAWTDAQPHRKPCEIKEYSPKKHNNRTLGHIVYIYVNTDDTSCPAEIRNFILLSFLEMMRNDGKGIPKCMKTRGPQQQQHGEAHHKK